MLDFTPDLKNNTESLLSNLINQPTSMSIAKEQREICQTLKPLKDKIIQIILTKGPISLTASMLELFYDNKRLIYTLRALANMIDRQIIIFTCHNREANILKREKMEYNYVEL